MELHGNALLEALCESFERLSAEQRKYLLDHLDELMAQARACQTQPSFR